MGTVLSVIQGANTGLLVWEQVGPWLAGLFEKNGEVGAEDPVTDEDLKAASVDLGMAISELDAAIAAKEKRDAGG